MTKRSWLTAVLTLAGTMPLAAQQAAELPDYTNDQRWGRLGLIDAAWVTTTIALGKSKGMTAEQIGDWIGDYFTTGWAGGLDARQFLFYLRWNHLAYPQGRVEVTTFSDSLVVARFNTALAGTYGPDRWYFGITTDELKTATLRWHQVLADFVGVRLDGRYDGDWLVLTLRNGYQAPRASAQIRWERAGWLYKIMAIEVIRIAKLGGMTPQQAAQNGVKVWADTWQGTDTPWRFFRWVAYNGMIDHNQTCAVETADAAMVKARCNRPWQAAVREQAERTGVTVEDYEAYMLAQEQGLAASLGFSWDAQIDGNFRILTVRRK